MILLSAWAESPYIGLNGIVLYDAQGKPIKDLKVNAQPRDMNSIQGHQNDKRVLANLTSGINISQLD